MIALAEPFLKPEKHIPAFGIAEAFFHPKCVRGKPVQCAADPRFCRGCGVPAVAHALVGVDTREPGPALRSAVLGFQGAGQAATVAVSRSGHRGVGRGVRRPILDAVGLPGHEGLPVVPAEVGAQRPRRGAVVQAGVRVVVVPGAVGGLKLTADPFQLVLFQDDVEDAGRAIGVEAGRRVGDELHSVDGARRQRLQEGFPGPACQS